MARQTSARFAAALAAVVGMMGAASVTTACGGSSAAHLPRTGPHPVKPWQLDDDATSAIILATSPGDLATVLELRASGAASLDVAPATPGTGTGTGSARLLRLEVSVTARAALPLTGEPTPKPLPPRAALSVRIAAAAAARLLNKDERAYVWTAGVAGSSGAAALDPGAEAALSVAFLAALTGAALDGKAAVAASVLPDGSLGPVEDLAAQATALIKAGKKRIGVPIAKLATAHDELAAAAKAGGAELVLVGDVAEAYQLLTGSSLPATTPAPPNVLALPTAVQTQLGALYAAWQQRLVAEWAALLLLDNAARLPPRLAQLTAAAQREAKRAEELRRAGAIPAALDRLLEASALAGAAVTSFRVVELMEQGKLDEATAALRERPATAEAAALLAALTAAPTTTTGDQLLLLLLAGDAFRFASTVQLSAPAVDAAAAQLAALAREPAIDLGSADTARRITAAIAPPLLADRRALAGAEMTRLILEAALRDEGGGPARPLAELANARPGAEPLATWARAAAALGEEELDALLYPEAAFLTYGASEAKPGGALAVPGPLFAWGTSLAAARAAGQLFAERETFAARRDADGSLATAGSLAAALPTLLATAERHARQSANASRAAIGAVPLALALQYQLGQGLARRPEVALQLRALAAYWSASAVADAALQLARAARLSGRSAQPAAARPSI